jgi:hypothetical protein
MVVTRIGLACLLVVTLLAAVGGACGRKKHPTGRDTVESFGDGRFQVGHGARDLGLYDSENQVFFLHLRDWRKKGDLVYMVNKKGEYAVLNHVTGVMQTFPALRDVPIPYRAQCERLKRTNK